MVADNLGAFGDNWTAGVRNVFRYYAQNHDASWNVLMSDGSVKSFVDPSHHIQRVAICKMVEHPDDYEVAITMGSQTRVLPGDWLETHVWQVYFDPLYILD